MDSVTLEEMSILRHTQKNGRFNGGGEQIASLVERGYLKCIGRPSWVPEDYFVLTEKGRDMVKAFQDPRKLSIDL